jgi:hypothetical protein
MPATRGLLIGKRLLAWSPLAISLAICWLLFFPSVHWPLWGVLRRESFYKNRPTSYWRAEIGARDTQRSQLWTRLFGLRPGPQPERPLMDCDRSGVPVLLQLLGDSDPDVRSYALFALDQMLMRIDPGPGPEDTPVLRAILHALHDPDLHVRRASAGALFQWDFLTRNSERADFIALVVPEMIDLLASESAGDRLEAIGRLNAIGPPAKAAVPALMRRLREDDDHTVRQYAAEALGRIGAMATDALPDLQRALEDDDPRVRQAAKDALWRIDPETQEALAGR